MRNSNIPALDIDLYDPASLNEPYECYRVMRDTASIVYLPKYGFYAMSRFADVQAALKDWQRFSSSAGVALSDAANAPIATSVLGAEGADHTKRKEMLSRPISGKNLTALRERITAEADKLIEGLVARGRFDGVRDLARHLPVTIVYELLGLPELSPDELLEGSEGSFNSLGPENSPLTVSGTAMALKMKAYAESCSRDRLKPGGWAANLFEMADQGIIDENRARGMMFDYLGPSLDTTILATGNAVKLFADNPDQWQALREKPSAIPGAINEIVRIESPIQIFSRLVREETEWGDQTIPAGSRVLMLYGSANRDERRWTDPERFDIFRENKDHVGFGYGVHSCLGANLARLEITALLSAMLPQIETLKVARSERMISNSLRGWRSLDVAIN